MAKIYWSSVQYIAQELFGLRVSSSAVGNAAKTTSRAEAIQGHEERTESLRKAITAAHHGWVKMVSDAEQDSWIVTEPENSEKLQSLEPTWFDGEFSRLIEIAFRGRIILTQQEALAQFRKTSRREITEDE